MKILAHVPLALAFLQNVEPFTETVFQALVQADKLEGLSENNVFVNGLGGSAATTTTEEGPTKMFSFAALSLKQIRSSMGEQLLFTETLKEKLGPKIG